MEKGNSVSGRRMKVIKEDSKESDVSALVDSLTSSDNDIFDRLKNLDSILTGLSDRCDELFKKIEKGESSQGISKQKLASADNKLEEIGALVTAMSDKYDRLLEGLRRVESIEAPVIEGRSLIDDDIESPIDLIHKLADKTMLDADKQADLIKKQIEERAYSRASIIISEAEEAKSVADRITAEAKKEVRERIILAEKQARSIIDSAEEQAEHYRAPAREEAANLVLEAKLSAGELEKSQDAAARDKSREMLKDAMADARNIMKKAEENAIAVNNEAEKSLLNNRESLEVDLKSIFDQTYQRLITDLLDAEQAPHVLIGKHSSAYERSDIEDVSGVHSSAVEMSRDNSLSTHDSDSDPVDAVSKSSQVDSESTTEEPSTSDDIRPESPDIQAEPEDVVSGISNEPTPLEEQQPDEATPELSDSTEDVSLTVEDPGIEHVNEGPPTEIQLDIPTFELEIDQNNQELVDVNSVDLSPVQPSNNSQIENNKVDKRDNTDKYSGAIELVIPPPVTFDRMLQFHKSLKQNPEVEVLNLGGSVDTGITIRVLAKSYVHLMETVREFSEVESASDAYAEGQKVVPGNTETENSAVERIIVTTKA